MKLHLIALSLVVAAALTFVNTADCRAASYLLTMTPTTISFPDQDPDLFPVVQGNVATTVTIAVKGNPFAGWSLTALARGNLLSAGSSIPVSNISFTGVKTGGDPDVTFLSGNLTDAVPGVKVVSGIGKEGSGTGTLSFFLQNLWTYDTGSYSQIVDFTLASP